jgi:hypothetical protein
MMTTSKSTKAVGSYILLLLLSSSLQGMLHVSAQPELLPDVSSYACAAIGTKECAIPSISNLDSNVHGGQFTSCPSSSSVLQLAEAQIRWLEERGGEFASDKMRILPLHNVTPNASEAADPCTLKQKNIELGIFATQNIVKDTILMRIPRSSLLTAGM